MFLQGQSWIKKLGNNKPKTSSMTRRSGTRLEWFSVYTPSLPVKEEEFLPSKLLPDASRMMCGSPGTLYIRRSHVSHRLVLAPSHSDMLNFPPSNYSCNLIMWCQPEHRLSRRVVDGFCLRKPVFTPVRLNVTEKSKQKEADCHKLFLF